MAGDTAGDGGGACFWGWPAPCGSPLVPALGLHVFLRTALKCPIHPTPVPATEAWTQQCTQACPVERLWEAPGADFPEVRSRQGQGTWLLIATLGTSLTPISFHC